MKKRIVFTVTTDLTYDQRMQRICRSLHAAGYGVQLVGRKKPASIELRLEQYDQKRIKCWFRRGKGFYLEFNLRLFFYLLTVRTDAFCAIDLDTILPVYLIAKWRRKPVVYDAHEYFTEMEEVVCRPHIKRAWQWVERITVPHISKGYTVSQGIVELLQQRYGVDYELIRNVALQRDTQYNPSDKPYVLYQGSVNVGRGMEPLIEAMTHIENCRLVICGKGDVYDDCVALRDSLGLQDRVEFKGYVPPDELRAITTGAHVGVTLFTNAGLSNQHSLANRFFDYLHGGVPQIAVAYPEYIRFNQDFEVAALVEKVEPKVIAEAIRSIVDDPQKHERLHQNCLKARAVHNWQQEEKKLLAFYKHLFE